MVGLVPYRVRLRDLDGFRHLSHIRLLELVEIGRIDLYCRLIGREGLDAVDLIMGEVRVRYMAPAQFGDDLTIGTVISGVGRSSVAFDYELWTAKGETVATARTVCVAFDYQAGRTKPLSDRILKHPSATTAPHPSELGDLPNAGDIRRRANGEPQQSAGGD